MRPTLYAALTSTTLLLSACGGENPAPQPPPLPPSPPAASANASAATTPTEPPPPAPPPKPALSDLIPRATTGLFAAFNGNDASREASYYADDVASYFYGSMRGSETHGKANVVGRTTLFSDAKLTPTRI